MFRHPVLAGSSSRPASWTALRVLEEVGAAAATYRTELRRLSAYAKQEFRHQVSAASVAHAWLGPTSLVLYGLSWLTSQPAVGELTKPSARSGYCGAEIRPASASPASSSPSR